MHGTIKKATSDPVPSAASERTADEAIAAMSAEFNKDWQAQVAGIIAMGRKLIQWKDDLREQYGHGHWGDLVEKLPISHRTADCLMRIADNPVLSNSQYVANLPPHWGTLYDLAIKLHEKELEAAIASGRINPDMERRDAAALIEEVLFAGNYSKLADALRVLIRFRHLHPDPSKIPDDAVVEHFGDLFEMPFLVEYLRDMDRHTERVLNAKRAEAERLLCRDVSASEQRRAQRLLDKKRGGFWCYGDPPAPAVSAANRLGLPSASGVCADPHADR